MASSPLRQLLEERISQLLADADQTAGDWRRRAVRDCAERLNQAVRRLRQAENLTALGAALVDSAAMFAGGAALFQIVGTQARLERVRGLPSEPRSSEPQPSEPQPSEPQPSEPRPLGSVPKLIPAPDGFEIPLALAPAIGGALESRDPVVAAALPGEVSSQLVSLLRHSPDVRVSILPIALASRVPAVLYAWDISEGSALELLAQVAASVWASLETPRVEKSSLVSIGPAAAAAAVETPAGGKPAQSWEDLSPENQALHLRAQRFARVKVAQMRLAETEAVQSGRARRTLYSGMQDAIDGARNEFREKFFAPCPGMLDYLHLEIVHTLANEDAELLGPDYPGPMV
jgi:hypothetical protein